MSNIPQSVLVTGANRGIGLGLVREFAKLPEVKLIFATTRNKANSQVDSQSMIGAVYSQKRGEMCLIQELEQLSKNDARIKVVEMDLHSDSSIQSAYKEVTKLLQMDGLHLLINNAGLLGNDGCKFPGVNRAKYMEVIEVNTVSPAVVTAQNYRSPIKQGIFNYMWMDVTLQGKQSDIFYCDYPIGFTVVQTFLPLLRKASQSRQSHKVGASRAAVINIGSAYGSIGDNDKGSAQCDSLAYRLSKTALNQLTKTLAVDLADDGILVTAITPGWVKTDMGTMKADLTVEESTTAVVQTILQLNVDHAGVLLRRNGEQINF